MTGDRGDVEEEEEDLVLSGHPRHHRKRNKNQPFVRVGTRRIFTQHPEAVFWDRRHVSASS